LDSETGVGLLKSSKHFEWQDAKAIRVVSIANVYFQTPVDKLSTSGHISPHLSSACEYLAAVWRARTGKLLEHVARSQASMLTSVVAILAQLIKSLKNLPVHNFRCQGASIFDQIPHNLHATPAISATPLRTFQRFFAPIVLSPRGKGC
jgi:hypothetical protein